MSRSVRPTDYRQPAPPPPVTYRIEWFGSLQVHQPVRPARWFADWDSPEDAVYDEVSK